jgi:peptide/nickel transport system substrate-binding protein
MKRRLIPLLAAVAVVASGSAAFAQKAGGTLKIAHRDNPPSASIHEEATISTVMPFASIYNNLVQFDQKNKQDSGDDIVPELATEWKWENGGKDLTFKLRDGVKWHDGVAFTSADVKCTWDMLKGDEDSKVRRNPRKIWYFNLREVTVNGPLEVTFHLNRPQPSMLTMLAGGHSPVYPCHVPVAQMRTKPIGTGPFMFDRMKQNESVRVVKNPNYWKKGHPYLDAIEFTIIPNRATSQLAFTSGRVDMTFVGDMNVPLLKDVQSQSPKAVCELLPTFTFSNLLVNRDKPPFDNAQIRTAMAYSIDRKAFVQILSQGVSKVGGIMLPPPEGRWGLPPEILATIPGYGPDVEKNRAEGKKIMEGLGYTADKPLKIKQHRGLSRSRGDPDRPVEAGEHRRRARSARHRDLVQPPDQARLLGRPQRPGCRHRRSGRRLLRDVRGQVGPQLHQLQQPGNREGVRRAVADDRLRGAPQGRLGHRQEAAARRRTAGDRPRLGRHLLAALRQGCRAVEEFDLQSLALRGRLARPLREGS